MNQANAVRRLNYAAERSATRARIAACIWAGVAVISVVAALSTALSERGTTRLAALATSPDTGFAGRIEQRLDQGDVTRLAAELDQLRSQVRLLALENQALDTRLSASNAEANPIATASLPDEAPAETSPERGEAHAESPPADSGGPQAAGGGRGLESNPERFALELGSGADIGELHAAWGTLVERHPDRLGGLEPTVGLAEGRDDPDRLRLIAGPVVDPAEAISACMELRQAGTTCHPVSGLGEPLTDE